MPYTTYILQSESGRFYIGQTNNLQNRLRRHNSGRSKFTKSRGPWRLVYSEQFSTRSEAVQRELELKRKHSRGAILGLISKSVQVRTSRAALGKVAGSSPVGPAIRKSGGSPP